MRHSSAELAGILALALILSAAGHVQIPSVYPEEFEQRIVGFFQAALG
jgi:hypothetical protein